MKNLFVLGLTGGIGAGKSTVAEMLGKLGARVLCADKMVHALLCEKPVIRRVVREFGARVLDGKKCIDRRELGAVAFASRKKIRALEKILHPAVIRATRCEIARLRKAPGEHVVVLDAPLVIEAGLNRLCDVMVFVDAPKKARLARVAKERGWGEAELKRREKRQKPLDYKRKSADFLIRNTLSRKNTLAQVRRLYKHIRHVLTEDGIRRTQRRPG